MTVAWRTTRDAIDAALARASDVDAAIIAPVRRRLVALGEVYDVRFPPPPAPDTPTTRIESDEHIAWRAAMQAAIRDLDELAARLDGGPTAPPTTAPAAVRARLEALLAVATAPERELVTAALATRLPPEPPYFTSSYYRPLHPQRVNRGWMVDGVAVSATAALLVQREGIDHTGKLEDALDAAIAAANVWLAIA